jgi:hypothetical protein
MDYRDHRPDRNAALFTLLASGVGLRQSARNLKLSRRCTELKARKIGRHLRSQNLNLRGPLAPLSSFQLDELETFEARRNTRPLTVPVLIETKSRFVVWAQSAPIPPSGRMSDRRRAAIAAEEKRFGRRPDGSRACVRRTLRRGQALAAKLDVLRIDTDEKSTYPGLIAEVFPKTKIEHHTTNSRLARGTWNRLFPINHTEAIARDLTGRLRRRSWLASKRRRWLDVALHVFIAYRNYVRRRVNRAAPTPAQELGFVPRAMTAEELLSWRQDGGVRSIHPLAKGAESVAEFAHALAKSA